MSDAASNLPAAPGPDDDDLGGADASAVLDGDVVLSDDGTEGIATGPGDAHDLTGTDEPDERYSPLHGVHVAAGAVFTDFAGWQMPVRYDSDLAEHHAVRTAAGLFDLSHMAEIAVVAAGASSYGDSVDGLAGVAPWLPCLYFAAGAVAARLWSALAAEA